MVDGAREWLIDACRRHSRVKFGSGAWTVAEEVEGAETTSGESGRQLYNSRRAADVDSRT